MIADQEKLMGKTVVVESLKRATATLFILHGMDDNSTGWLFFANNWRRNVYHPDFRLVLLNAPTTKFTLDVKKRAWYDMETRDDLDQTFWYEAGMKRSRDFLRGWIQWELDDGIPSERIFIFGHGMGGTVALFTALTHPFKLGGVIVESTQFPLAGGIWDEICASDRIHDTPVHMTHGSLDKQIPLCCAEATAERLRKLNGDNADLQIFETLGHDIIAEIAGYVSARITSWLQPDDDAFSNKARELDQVYRKSPDPLPKTIHSSTAEGQVTDLTSIDGRDVGSSRELAKHRRGKRTSGPRGGVQKRR